MAEDFYDLLDVSADADRQEITAAFREKAREFHPDVNDDDRADEQFKTVRRARDVLTDPEERAAYDRLGHETYVARRMGGLPTFGWDETGQTGTDAESDEGGTARSQQTRRSERAGARNRDSASDRSRDRTGSNRSREGTGPDRSGADGERSDDRYGSGSTYTRRRRQQRAARRRRRLTTEAAALAATLTYLVGASAFLRAGGGPSVTDADPAAFSRTALASLSPETAFPVGAVLFPLGVGSAALVANRWYGAGVAALALGPTAVVAGAVAGVASAPLSLAGLFVAPAVALLGVGWLAAARRG